MKIKNSIQKIGLAGLIALACNSYAADSKKSTNFPSAASTPISQLFSPLKTLYSPTCLLYCIQLPGGVPQKCFYDPSVPRCAALNK